MASDCTPLIPLGPVFPRRPVNRPALDRISYRIGEYPDMVAAMMRTVDGEVALSAWTHRGADDPAVALLQGVGIVGDILTFYQDRYANEAYLRTADWRDSVAGLVRLLGYRLTPGLGGHTTLAVELKGDKRVIVPAGHPFKADLEGRDTPADFQTDAELVAYPALSKFHLYRRRNYPSYIAAGKSTLEIRSVGGSRRHHAIAALDLKPGDTLLLLPASPNWVQNANVSFLAQSTHQVLKVKEVVFDLGRTKVTFETPLARGWEAGFRAYRLGRTWRHFGHGSPASYTKPKPSTGEVTWTKQYTTGFERHIHEGHSCANTSTSINLPGRNIPLDADVPDLMRGSFVIVESRVRKNSTTRTLVVRRKITSLRSTSLGFANQTAPTTIIRMNNGLLNRSTSDGMEADIRDYRIHEVTSPTIRFDPVGTAPGGGITTSIDALAFYGRRRDVRRLAGRKLMMVHDDGRTLELTNTDTRQHFTGGNGDPKMWHLSFDAVPDLFRQRDFDEAAPRVTVYANTVTGSEGKALGPVPLGNGDKRQVFQTFRLPKPATHHLHPGADPAEVPELTVYVDGRAATRVSSLYGQPADALVYVLRIEGDGQQYVQFGDGKTGARLTSGTDNVTAVLRFGSGARGVLPEGALPSGPRIDGVAKLHMPAGVAGGADPETGDNARAAAPGKVQGLGRIVSLRDYETELLTIPGVTRVKAAWDMSDGTPGVVLRVLLESGREAEYDAVRDAIQGFQKCRGSNRFALEVTRARLRQIYLDLTYSADPTLMADDVAQAVTDALAPMDTDATGLFTLTQRQIGEPEYATRIEGCVQALPQIRWARVKALGKLPALPEGDTPDMQALPPAPRSLSSRVTPTASELLQLHSTHLTLTAAAPDTAEDCT